MCCLTLTIHMCERFAGHHPHFINKETKPWEDFMAWTQGPHGLSKKPRIQIQVIMTLECAHC